jgi:membrane protein required for colicin V production
MNGLDLAVVTVIVMSGVFAFARGFVKEALSIVAWVGAAFAALYGSAYLLPMAGRALPKGPTTEVVAGIVLFLVVLVALSLLTSAVSRRVKQSGLSAVDRSLGLVFGLLRGVVLVCLGYLALAWALPSDERQQPAWMTHARPATRPGAGRLPRACHGRRQEQPSRRPAARGGRRRHPRPEQAAQPGRGRARARPGL